MNLIHDFEKKTINEQFSETSTTKNLNQNLENKTVKIQQNSNAILSKKKIQKIA